MHWPYFVAVGHNFSNMVFGVKDGSIFNLKSMTLVYEDEQRVWFSTALSFKHMYTMIKHVIELFRSLLNMTMTSADLELNWEHSKPLAKRTFSQIFPHLLYLYPRLSHRFSFASPRLDKQYRHRYLLDFQHEGILDYRGYWNSFFQIKMTGYFEQNPSPHWPCYQKELDIGLVSFVYIYTVTDFRITESVWINRLDWKKQWEKMTHYPPCVFWFPGPLLKNDPQLKT